MHGQLNITEHDKGSDIQLIGDLAKGKLTL